MKKYFRIIFILILLSTLFMGRSLVFAQGVGLEATVSKKSITLEEFIQLTVTVRGTQKIEGVNVPKMEDFDIQYVGPSQRMSIVNGQVSQSKSFTYKLFPYKVGKFQIPMITAVVSGQTYEVQPIDIEVMDASRSSAPGVGSSQSRDNTTNEVPMSLRDRIFVKFKIAKEKVYLHEKVPIKIFLFIAEGLSIDERISLNLDGMGYRVDGFQGLPIRQQVIDGVRYNIAEFDTYIYSTRTGGIEVGPAKVDCQLRYEGKKRSPFGGMGSIFDDDFFGSIFNQVEYRPLSLESSSKALEVMALPEAGKPDDFSGAVGYFDFVASADPRELKIGDPITLKMGVSGEGDLDTVKFPKLDESKNLKLYEPTINEEGNRKILEQVVIPTSDQVTEIPAIQFSYFDPKLESYQTIKKGPFPIEVKQLKEGEKLSIVGLENPLQSREKEILGKDIVFIKDRPGSLRLKGKVFHRSIAFYLMLIVILAVWFFFYIYYQKTYRLETDIVYARRLLAPKHAKKALGLAKKLKDQGKKVEFYDALYKSIQMYMSHKFHLSLGIVTYDRIQKELNANNIDQGICNDVESIIDECDRIRYASAQITDQNMEESLHKLEKIIDYLERNLK